MIRPYGGATHTYAALEVTAAAYDEIAGKLRAAGYDHAFDVEEKAIDMHGIGLVKEAQPLESAVANRVESILKAARRSGIAYNFVEGQYLLVATAQQLDAFMVRLGVCSSYPDCPGGCADLAQGEG